MSASAIQREQRPSAAPIALVLALGAGCLGRAHGVPQVGGAAGGRGSVVAATASSSAPPLGPTTWALPHASLYVGMPPAGVNGGPTKPCAPHVQWPPGPPPAPGTGLEGGAKCTGFRPVRYPVCTDEQVARAWRLDVAMTRPEGPPDIFGRERGKPFALRAYLRRDVAVRDGEWWDLRIEALQPDGRCAEVAIPSCPAGALGPTGEVVDPYTNHLCKGDETLACCLSPLVGADVEVVYETGRYDGQLCVVAHGAEQDGVRAHPRSIEERFNRTLSIGIEFP